MKVSMNSHPGIETIYEICNAMHFRNLHISLQTEREAFILSGLNLKFITITCTGGSVQCFVISLSWLVREFLCCRF